MVARISCGAMCYWCIFRGPTIRQFLIASEAAGFYCEQKVHIKRGKPRTSNIADDINAALT